MDTKNTIELFSKIKLISTNTFLQKEYMENVYAVHVVKGHMFVLFAFEHYETADKSILKPDEKVCIERYVKITKTIELQPYILQTNNFITAYIDCRNYNRNNIQRLYVSDDDRNAYPTAKHMLLDLFPNYQAIIEGSNKTLPIVSYFNEGDYILTIA